MARRLWPFPLYLRTSPPPSFRPGQAAAFSSRLAPARFLRPGWSCGTRRSACAERNLSSSVPLRFLPRCPRRCASGDLILRRKKLRNENGVSSYGGRNNPLQRKEGAPAQNVPALSHGRQLLFAPPTAASHF